MIIKPIKKVLRKLQGINFQGSILSFALVDLENPLDVLLRKSGLSDL